MVRTSSGPRRRLFIVACTLLLLFAQHTALAHALWHALGSAPAQHEHSARHAQVRPEARYAPSTQRSARCSAAARRVTACVFMRTSAERRPGRSRLACRSCGPLSRTAFPRSTRSLLSRRARRTCARTPSFKTRRENMHKPTRLVLALVGVFGASSVSGQDSDLARLREEMRAASEDLRGAHAGARKAARGSGSPRGQSGAEGRRCRQERRNPDRAAPAARSESAFNPAISLILQGTVCAHFAGSQCVRHHRIRSFRRRSRAARQRLSTRRVRVDRHGERGSVLPRVRWLPHSHPRTSSKSRKPTSARSHCPPGSI